MELKTELHVLYSFLWLAHQQNFLTSENIVLKKYIDKYGDILNSFGNKNDKLLLLLFFWVVKKFMYRLPYKYQTEIPRNHCFSNNA